MRPRILLAVAMAATIGTAGAQERRLLTPDDIFDLRTVADPRVSPDAAWVAYTVSTLDREADRSARDIYMAPLAGGEALRLTFTPASESAPRWSPDNRYLAFLSSRDGEHTQVWLLDRRGGEASRLTDFGASVSSMAWSPDGSRLALIITDEADEEPDNESDSRPGDAATAESGQGARPKPIVIDRLQFKRDTQGYLTERRRHLYVFDLASKQSTQITDGPYDDSSPAWSPDGSKIAFVSNRTNDPDANADTDIFLVEATAGTQPRALTTSARADTAPVFSLDGRRVAYLEGGEPADIWYGVRSLAIVPVAGGAARNLTATLDRNVSSPRFSSDGTTLLFLLEDAGNRHLARVPADGGPVERVVTGERDIRTFDTSPDGALVILEGRLQRPAEIARVDPDGAVSRITHENDAFLAGVRLATVERFTARSPDGTPVDGFLTRPPDAADGVRLPTVLRIHGGPVSQFSTRFSVEWQLLAAHGYAVVAANPRGSSGHGRDFSYAIWADWGHKDFQDVMAAVDRVVTMGVADPERLGVGGWSYGGILTDYVITQTGRFKAAISGASEVNYLADYGTDHYQRQWEAELGLPWVTTDLWIRMSSFFKVDRVVTPTLIMGGQDDMNVPLLNSEQLYQALRRLGVDTQLVIYPGQHHGIRRPSFQKDRYERYLAWYDRYLRTDQTSSAGEP